MARYEILLTSEIFRPMFTYVRSLTHKGEIVDR